MALWVWGQGEAHWRAMERCMGQVGEGEEGEEGGLPCTTGGVCVH